MGKKRIKKMLGLTLVSLLFPITVQAYIDPTTTAILTQIVVGIFITLGVAIKVFWQRIVVFFKKIKIKLFKK